MIKGLTVASSALVLTLLVAGCGPHDSAINAFRSGSTQALGPAGAGGPAAAADNQGSASAGDPNAVAGPAGPGAVTGAGGSGATTGLGASSVTGTASSGSSGSYGTMGSVPGSTATAGAGATIDRRPPTSTSGGGTGSSRPGTQTPGSASTPGVTATTIKLGFHEILSGYGIPVESLLHLKAVTQAYWDWVNNHGGINGRRVVLDIQDDGTDANKAAVACKTILADGAFAVGGTGGADATEVCGQMVSGAGVPYLSPGVGEAGLVGRPMYFPLTITYDQQAPMQAQYLVHRMKAAAADVAMVSVDSANFQGASAKFSAEMKALTGHPPAVNVAVNASGDPSQLQQVCVTMFTDKVKYVTMLLPPNDTTVLVEQCHAMGYNPQYIGWANTDPCDNSPSTVGTPDLNGCVAFESAHEANSAAGQASTVEKTCHAAWSAEQSGKFPTDEESFCGYFDVIRQALTLAGPDLDRASFATALRAMNYSDGLLNPVNFAGGTHGADAVVLWQATPSGYTEIESKWETSF